MMNSQMDPLSLSPSHTPPPSLPQTPPPSPSRATSVVTSKPPAPAAPHPASIRWGRRGEGLWQNLAPSIEPPPQDADEGGTEGGAGLAAGARSTLESTHISSRERRSGASHASEVIDLTGSEDEVACLRPAQGSIETHLKPAARAERKRDRADGASAEGRNDRQRVWCCPRCNFSNPEESFSCAMGCGHIRHTNDVPQEPTSRIQSRWTCVVCTLTNPKGYSHCEACGSWRYTRPL